MAYINDIVFDDGLNVITNNAARLDVTFTQEATSYIEATSTFSCAVDAVTVGSPVAGDPSGRAVIIPAITAGTVSDTQLGGWWALTDGVSVLYATGTLAATQQMTIGNTFTLTAIEITVIDAASV
jgi:hypothetical protein